MSGLVRNSQFSLCAAFFASALLANGCVSNSTTFAQNQNALRPALVMKYEYALQSATNNVESFKQAVSSSLASTPKSRQVVVVSNIGDGGDAVAMERAKKAALMTIKAGELQPRIYVRQPNQQWQRDTVEFFVMPIRDWDDSAFAYVMASESLMIQPLGGVLKAEVGRNSLNEVLERRLDITSGNLAVALNQTLKKVGWSVEGIHIPPVDVPDDLTIAVAVNETGVATPVEALSIARAVISLAGNPKLEIRTDIRRGVVEVYGEETK